MDDFGGKLRQARERRGISLRQIAASTKISAAALEALERNDISKLPGGIFSRAFVRAYAVEVGLDPDDTVKEFLDRFNQEPPPTAESAATVPQEETDFEHKQKMAALALKIALVGIPVLILILYFSLRNRSAVRAEGEPARNTTAPADAAAPSAPAPATATPTAPAAAATPPPAPGQLKLDIHPTAECWVSLTVDGRKLFARVMQRGERETHTVQREAVVEIGDAGAFAFTINGRAGKSLGDVGQVKTLKLTPATAAQYTR
jgi:cytoskeletal protein RodZ